MENNLVEKLSEKLMCLEEDLFSRMIENVKLSEKLTEKNNSPENRAKQLNKKLKQNRSLL